MSKFDNSVVWFNVYSVHHADNVCYSRDLKEENNNDITAICISKESFFSNLDKFFNDHEKEDHFLIQFYCDERFRYLDINRINKVFIKNKFIIECEDNTDNYLFILRRLNIGESVLNCV